MPPFPFYLLVVVAYASLTFALPTSDFQSPNITEKLSAPNLTSNDVGNGFFGSGFNTSDVLPPGYSMKYYSGHYGVPQIKAWRSLLMAMALELSNDFESKMTVERSYIDPSCRGTKVVFSPRTFGLWRSAFYSVIYNMLGEIMQESQGWINEVNARVFLYDVHVCTIHVLLDADPDAVTGPTTSNNTDVIFARSDLVGTASGDPHQTSNSLIKRVDPSDVKIDFKFASGGPYISAKGLYIALAQALCWYAPISPTSRIDTRIFRGTIQWNIKLSVLNAGQAAASQALFDRKILVGAIMMIARVIWEKNLSPGGQFFLPDSGFEVFVAEIHAPSALIGEIVANARSISSNSTT